MKHAVAISILMASPLAWISIASAGPTDMQKCEAAKIKESGKYYLCRMKAESKAAKKGEDPDFAKCDQKLNAKFASIEGKFGGSCTTAGDAAQVQSQVETTATDLACQLKGFSEAPGASIVVFSDLQVSANEDPVVRIRNPSNTLRLAHCFYASRSGCSLVEFLFALSARETIEWQTSTGIFLTIPPVPQFPFSGDLVCVEVDTSFEPTPGNSLIGSLIKPNQCPVNAFGIAGSEDNNFDQTLTLGGPFEAGGFDEYDPCPVGIDPAHIETCWSTSAFTFECK